MGDNVSPIKKVRIINEETGAVIRVGPARIFDTPNEKRLLGIFTVSDAIKVALIMFSATTFLIVNDERLKSVEKRQEVMATTMDRLIIFNSNSDGFNSMVYHTQFRDGKPLNDSYHNNGDLK